MSDIYLQASATAIFWFWVFGVFSFDDKWWPCAWSLVMFSQYGELRLISIWHQFGAPQQISTGFACLLRYCTDVTQRTSTKLCMMFGRLLGWYTTYTFLGVLPRNRILPDAKFTLQPSLAFWHCYCMALEQWVSAKLCVVQHRVPHIFRILL